jgi:serine/threonine-protein kinase HipA
MKRCQICGKEITRGKNPKYHPICIKRTFGAGYVPDIAVSMEDIPKNFKKIEDKFSLDHIQPRFPLRLNRKEKHLEPVEPSLLDPEAENGDFILKPQVRSFSHLPEIEKICMTSASLYGIDTSHHCLVRLEDGATAYLVRRFDRQNGAALPQKTIRELLSREKRYMGDLLDVGKKIRGLSEFPGLGVQYFFERVMFAFIVGHNALHLDSFTMLYDEDGRPRLAPVSDFISCKLVLPNCDDFAMPMNNKTNAVRGHDFREFAKLLRIPDKAYSKMFLRFYKRKRVIGRLIKESRLTTEEKIKFSDIVNERFKRLFI